MHDGDPVTPPTWRTRVRAVARQAVRTHLWWDLAMVYLALANITLIAFDWTYLWLRPTYVRYVPVVARVYDPVKGIAPVPAAEQLLDGARALRERGPLDGPTITRRITELADFTASLVSSNPYERTGQTRAFNSLNERIRRYVVNGNPLAAADPVEAARAYWLDARRDLDDRLNYFDQELRPLVLMAYSRAYDRDGEFVDRFWLLDLPFVVIFVSEFAVRWGLAVRRRTYPRWFFYPVIHWYDALGSLPHAELRLLRFLRVVSIYRRLRRGVLSGLSADPLSRAASYVGDVIKEEVSDMVTLRILEETQEELRSGTHARIVRAIMEPRQQAIANEIVERLGNALSSVEVRDKLREFLRENLDRSVDSAPAFKNLPLPSVVLTPLVRGVGEIVFDSFADTLQATFEDPRGRRILDDLVGQAVHGVIDEVTAGELEVMIREIALESIEHMKVAVARRKWMEA